MGMGYGAGYADTITEKAIKKICPKEFITFNKIITESELNMDNVAQFLDDKLELDTCHIEDDKKAEELQGKIIDAYANLQSAFYKKTKLELDIGFHDSDNDGDRYDDINGHYWCCGPMSQLTPAAKRLQKKVGKTELERKFFVNFG